MKYILPLVAAALLSVGFLAGEADANSNCNCPACQAARQGYYQQQQPRQMTVFQKLMELERRKNAWLRKTFLGR